MDFGMQDILDLTAKLPTQKQENEQVAGVQQIIYTEEQKERLQLMWKEQLWIHEIEEQQARQAASTTTEGNSKLTPPEKKTRKNKVLSKTSSASKPKNEKDKPIPAIKKDIELTVNAPGGTATVD